MNANPAFAASAGVSPNGGWLQGTPALLTRGVRAHGSVHGLDSFDAYRVSLEACRACAPIVAALSSNLRDQLLRASSSVVLNIAEGFGSSSRGVKRRHYSIARGSAIECIAVLDLASVIGVGVGSGEADLARGLFTRAATMTAKLVARFR